MNRVLQTTTQMRNDTGSPAPDAQATLHAKSLCAIWLKGVSGVTLEEAPACDAWWCSLLLLHGCDCGPLYSGPAMYACTAARQGVLWSYKRCFAYNDAIMPEAAAHILAFHAAVLVDCFSRARRI